MFYCISYVPLIFNFMFALISLLFVLFFSSICTSCILCVLYYIFWFHALYMLFSSCLMHFTSLLLLFILSWDLWTGLAFCDCRVAQMSWISGPCRGLEIKVTLGTQMLTIKHWPITFIWSMCTYTHRHITHKSST